MAREMAMASAERERKSKLLHLEVHPMKGGHMVRHVMDHYDAKPVEHVFAKADGGKLMAHIAKHAKISMPDEPEALDNAKEEAGEGM